MKKGTDGVISQQTPITVGLFLLVAGISCGAIFKAGQVLTEFEYVKSAVAEIRVELADIKRLVRQYDPNKSSYNYDQGFEDHTASTVARAAGSR